MIIIHMHLFSGEGWPLATDEVSKFLYLIKILIWLLIIPRLTLFRLGSSEIDIYKEVIYSDHCLNLSEYWCPSHTSHVDPFFLNPDLSLTCTTCVNWVYITCDSFMFFQFQIPAIFQAGLGWQDVDTIMLMEASHFDACANVFLNHYFPPLHRQSRFYNFLKAC